MVHVKINENTKQAKALIAMLKTMPFVELIENNKHIPNAVTKKAINDARLGKVTRAKDVSDLIQKLRS